jgi:hypothetical protein
MSPRSSIGCVQNDFCPNRTFDANSAPILNQDYHYLQTDRAFTWASSPRSTIGCVQNDFHAYGTFDANRAPILRQDLHYLRKDEALTWASSSICTYVAPTLTLSPNGYRRDSTWPTSPRGSIGCVQNDFRAYGTFDLNHGPILNQD